MGGSITGTINEHNYIVMRNIDFDKALAIDPNHKDALDGKSNALSKMGQS